jgi:hypothetical protein
MYHALIELLDSDNRIKAAIIIDILKKELVNTRLSQALYIACAAIKLSTVISTDKINVT